MKAIISWQLFLGLSVVSIGGYYLFLALIYRKNLIQKNSLIAGQMENNLHVQDLTANQTTLFEGNNSPDRRISNAEPTDGKTIIHEFIDELNSLTAQSELQNVNKEQMMNSLKLLLKKYLELHDSVFRQELTNLIQIECENKCGIHLDAEEVASLWLKG